MLLVLLSSLKDFKSHSLPSENTSLHFSHIGSEKDLSSNPQGRGQVLVYKVM